MFLDYNLDIEKQSIWLMANDNSGGSPFPFAINEIGLFHAKAGYFTSRHEKNDFLLLYTLSGQGELDYRNQLWPMGEGSVALINCNLHHSYRTVPASPGNWVFYWMHFSSPYVQEYYRLIYEAAFSPLPFGQDYDLKHCFQDAMDILEQSHGDTGCMLSSCVSTALTRMVSFRHQSARKPAHEQAIQQAVAYIKENYRQPLDLDDLARRVNLSKYYFIKLFQQHMCSTPYNYLLLYRIGEAKKLLISTSYKVVEISNSVGFSDESNFSRTFKRFTGKTPIQYRLRL